MGPTAGQQAPDQPTAPNTSMESRIFPGGHQQRKLAFVRKDERENEEYPASVETCSQAISFIVQEIVPHFPFILILYYDKHSITHDSEQALGKICSAK